MMNNERSFRKNYRNASRRGRQGRHYNSGRHPNNETWNSNQSYRNYNPNESRYDNYHEAREDNYNLYNNTRTNFHTNAICPRNREFEENTSSAQQNRRTNISNITNETSESKVSDDKSHDKPKIHIKFANPWLEENEKNLHSSQVGTSGETKILNEDTETNTSKAKIEKKDIKVEQAFEVSKDNNSSTTCESVTSSPKIIDVYDSDELLKNYPDTTTDPTEISHNSNNISQTQNLLDLRDTKTGTAIFISNLSRHISEADLRTFYERYGTINSLRMFPKPKNRKGHEKCCIVIYNNEEDAIKSLETNGLYCKWYNLQVRLFSSKSIKHSIYVTNCPKKTTVQELYDVFESCGPVEQVIQTSLKMDNAIISFEMEESVELAILSNNFQIRNIPLKISNKSTWNAKRIENLGNLTLGEKRGKSLEEKLLEASRFEASDLKQILRFHNFKRLFIYWILVNNKMVPNVVTQKAVSAVIPILCNILIDKLEKRKKKTKNII